MTNTTDMTDMTDMTPATGVAERARATRPPAWKRALSRARAWTRRVGPRGMLLLALIALFLTSLTAIAGAQALSTQYSQTRAHASAGLAHLRIAQALLAPYLKHPAIPDSATLTQFSAELTAGRRNLSAARADLTGVLFGGATVSPAGRTALALLVAADDVCQAGLAVSAGLEPIANAAHGGFFAPEPATGSRPATTPATTPAPALTPAIVATLTARYEQALGLLQSAITRLRSADLSSLPSGALSAQQVAALRGLLANWPSFQAHLNALDGWLRAAPALLGLKAPERFLIELMDRGEMRATGGFIGAYGVMTIARAQIQPFTLADVFTLDVPYLDRGGVSTPPAPYSWWPFRGYGLRDSNLSPDFPTSARMGMSMLSKEGGPAVQGVVALNARTIERILRLVGPVTVPGYNVTVTDKNLETMIRLYTETAAQRDGNDLPVSYRLTSIHERFTALLGQRLMAKVRAYALHNSGALIQALWTSVSTKDVQVYVGDPATEALLAQANLAGALPSGQGDAVSVVDSNITGNKASALTAVTYSDAVTLDAHGAATHHLTITYALDSSINPSLIHFLYHRDYLLTYLRVYAPRGARLVSARGFLNGQAPTSQSDIPWRQMWAGLVRVEDGSPITLQLIWTVAAAPESVGRYTLVYQHQSGANQRLILTITGAGASAPSVIYNGALDRDLTFAVNPAR